MPNDPLIAELNGLLADATIFYQKARHYHWNVTGNGFFTLHRAFEDLYTTWADTIDDLAERIRTIGGIPVHTLAAILVRATLEEDDSVPKAEDMVRRIAYDMEALHASVSDVRERAEKESPGTADLLSRIVDDLEKDLWKFGAWLHRKEAPVHRK